MFGRTLTYAQKQKLTNSLFYTVAAGAVLTVALPSLLPCPVKANGRVAGMVYADDQRHQKNAKMDTRKVQVLAALNRRANEQAQEAAKQDS